MFCLTVHATINNFSHDFGDVDCITLQFGPPSISGDIAYPLSAISMLIALIEVSDVRALLLFATTQQSSKGLLIQGETVPHDV
jgi:hypothetical protein